MLHSKWCLIYEFIDNGLSDQKLATLNTDGFLPLSEEEFNKMLQYEANYKSSEYIEFFRFFMPILHQNASIANLKKIHPLQILPLNMTSLIGHGGHSKVYALEILSGYHDLKYTKVCSLL
jgi:hypothetical protein